MSQENKFNLKAVFSGSLISLILTVILIFICAIIYYFSNISQSVVNLIIFFIVILSVFWGSFITSKNVSSRGFLYGLMTAVFYFIIIISAAFIINKNFSLSGNILSMLGGGICAGILGGILGVNM